MSQSERVSVSISKAFQTSAERVFDAWLDPTMVRHWFAPGLGEMVRVELDPREGGAFHLDQRRGEEIARHWGTYLAIERPHRLAFTWCVDGVESEDLVVIEIESTHDGCRLTLTHQMAAEFADYRDLTERGWTLMLEGMATGLATDQACMFKADQHGRV